MNLEDKIKDITLKMMRGDITKEEADKQIKSLVGGVILSTPIPKKSEVLVEKIKLEK